MRSTALKDLSQMQLTMPASNQFARKTVSSLPGEEQTVQIVAGIENQLNEQEKDLSEIQKALKEIKKESNDFKKTLVETTEKCQG